MTRSASVAAQPAGEEPKDDVPPRKAGMTRWKMTVSATSAAALAATAAVALISTRADTPDDDAHPYDRARFQREVDAVHATGVVGVLGEVQTASGTLSARSGVADLTTRAVLPWGAHFRIGSATKTFVATVVLQLAGEGRLSLDDTVEKWLPGVVRGNGNDGRKVTVRELLQHTSGIPNYLTKPVDSPEAWRRTRFQSRRPEQLVTRAMRQRPEFAPGTRWSYSNTNYVLAGMIIQRVTGRTWRQEVERRIAQPLGLHQTSTPAESPYLPNPHATAYQRFTKDGPLTDVTAQNQTVGDAAGAIISTTGDLNRFYRALADGRLLKPAEQAAMRATVPAPPLQAMGSAGARYGLGILYRPLTCGGGYWSHGGDADGYRTRLGVTPDGRRSAVVSVTSRSPGDLAAEQRTDRALSDLIDHALCG